MNTPGTIDRPATHGPVLRPFQYQDPTMNPSAQAVVAADNAARTYFGAIAVRQNRTRQMQLIPEALARAQMEQRMREVDSERLGVRLAAARRMQLRAGRASLRARRALARVVMQ